MVGKLMLRFKTEPQAGGGAKSPPNVSQRLASDSHVRINIHNLISVGKREKQHLETLPPILSCLRDHRPPCSPTCRDTSGPLTPWNDFGAPFSHSGQDNSLSFNCPSS